MKKQSIPTGDATPEWARAVRENLEVMAGRRNNKFAFPTVQTLTFSNPPTQGECQALNAYVNEGMKALTAIAARFDE